MNASNQLNWGLIGCGDVVRKRVAAAIQDDPRSRLVAACRRNSAALAEFAQAFKVPASYRDAESLIADPSVDAVYIATPVREHLPQTIAAARAGKHVLVEKPMALDLSECDEMISACQEAGVKLGVAYYRRFYAIVSRIEELLAAGEIGVPLNVTAVTATPPLTADQEGYWRTDLATGGGGALMDIGSHRINIFQFLFGEIAKIVGVCASVASSYEAEDTAVFALQFESGVTGTLQCHFGCWADPDEFTILGTLGRISAKPLNGSELSIETTVGKRVESWPPPENLCGPLVCDFSAAVLDGRLPTVTGEEGRAANAVIAQAYRSANAKK